VPNIAIVPLHGSFMAPSFERATVGDAMHPGLLTCDRVSHLVVTEAGRPVGILSSLDIARILAADAVAWESMATTD
jgi:CBS domain-containing protein